ncbi:hypothetical protein X772_33005 [Mesorhizobium sp. LSJC280B00]|nr:hypothetical protein X772_33005 [Mesorhizobium sp. LSJC280B00]
MGTLFRTALQLLNLALHAGDLFFFFHNLHFEAVFGLGSRLDANGIQSLLDLPSDSQRHLPLLVVKRALLFQVRM